MIKVGNFSGDVQECLKMGKTEFIKVHKGKFNGDINDLWELINSKKPKK